MAFNALLVNVIIDVTEANVFEFFHDTGTSRVPVLDQRPAARPLLSVWDSQGGVHVMNQSDRVASSTGGARDVVTEERTVRIPIESSGDLVAVRQAGRALGSQAGFSVTDLTIIIAAISEIVQNILEYARDGEVRITIIDGSGTTGIEVVASDAGPGIPEIATVMRDFYSTGSGLGIGLPGARRLMDEFEITSTAGKGTLVRMRKWL